MRASHQALTLLAAVVLLAVARLGSAASAQEIDIRVDNAIERFEKNVGGAEEFIRAAHGILVFPRVVKAGLVFGGEYGEGALRIGGQTVEYYNIASGSFGFQLGAQAKTEIILFMQQDALETFRSSDGWKAGVDGSVAVVKWGAGGSVDTTNIRDPIVAFIFGNRGLMYNLTLEGSKITRIAR